MMVSAVAIMALHAPIRNASGMTTSRNIISVDMGGQKAHQVRVSGGGPKQIYGIQITARKNQ
jgi:hypothetical protein